MSASRVDPSRPEAVEHVAHALLGRSARLTRLLSRRITGSLTRTEGGLLSALEDGPRRITELAACEALAQPTTTQLVGQLEQRGYVTRQRAGDDGRAVIVSLTGSGATALQSTRAQYGALLHDYVVDLPDAEVRALVAATDALQHIIDRLQRSAPGPSSDTAG